MAETTPFNPYELIEGWAGGQPIEQSWWCNYFYDDNPLGWTFVQAPSPPLAISATWALEANPGGAVLTVQLPDGYIDRVPQAQRNRLLTDGEFRELAETRTIDELLYAFAEATEE